MKRYFAYVRVSTTRQHDEGTSPQEQRHAITGYALRHGLEIERWYQESETAAKRGRPAFTAMLRELRKSRATGIVMHKIDRSARNLGDWAVLLELVDAGIEVHFVHESVDLTTRGGRLTANIQAVMAADYSRNLSDEVKKGQLGRLRQGLYPLPAPRGYLDQGKAKPKIIDPVQGPLIREAFERYSTGAYSVDMLRREMARRGLARGGSPLSRNRFTQILHNPFYTGLIRYGSHQELFAGSHEPLISLELFERVQVMLTGRSGGKIQTHNFQFRRRMRCARCSRTLTGERQKGHVYYRCHNSACPTTIVREALADGEVRDKLSLLQLGGKELGDMRDVMRELIASERNEETKRDAVLRLELAKLDERLNRLTDLLMDETVDRATYLKKKEALLKERQAVNEAIGRGDISYWRELSEKLELGFAAYLLYEIGFPDEKLNIVDRLGSNFVVRGKEPEFALRSPYAEWAEWSKLYKGGPYSAQLRTKPDFRTFLNTLAPPVERPNRYSSGLGAPD